VKAHVLLAAKIWVAVDPDDRVAKLVWAMATKSVPLGPAAEIAQAQQAVRDVAPWFAEQDLQQRDSVVVQRLQRMRVFEVCGSLDVELPRLVETYSKQVPDDVGMAFPDRDPIEAKIEGCKRARSGTEQTLRKNEWKARENDLPAEREQLRALIKSDKERMAKHEARLRRWLDAQQRL